MHHSLTIFLQSRQNEIHVGGLERGARGFDEKEGPRGLHPGKLFMTTPFRLLENAPFLENLPLTEAEYHD